ncbi:Gfo/Idh/MocA family oxidoreductase [Amylibacter sp.]|nr:Gfo/Idh/MocA family oxidoreductase [Amylibacter sp.]
MKIAILGASGIGKFHARTFDKLDVEVNSILCSSKVTGKSTSQDLKDSLGLKVNYYDDLDTLLSKSIPDAVTICTPNELHYAQILKVLDKNIPIFCEKPLFWNKKDSYTAFSNKLKVISDHPNRAIFVNTSGAGYVKSIKNLLPLSEDLQSFNFNFTTQGNNKYIGIAEDLMPHGLAMLIELLGFHDITSLKQEYSEGSYKCNFLYAGRKISFNFKQGKLFKKEFIFYLNEDKYVRIQNSSLKNYEVSLDCITQNKKIKIDDPFEVYASRFIDFCSNRSNRQKDEFNESSHNLNLMAKILLVN